MRLNKEIRQKMIDKAYELSAIPQARKELTKRSIALSEAVRLDGLGGKNVDNNLRAAEKEIKMLLGKRDIPDGFNDFSFKRSDYALALFGETNQTLHFHGSLRIDRENVIQSDSSAEYRKFATCDRQEYGHDHALTIEYESLVNEAKKLKEDEEILRAKVGGAVFSFSSTEKLIEHWPEAAALIPKHIEKASKPMPIALAVQDLNHIIGLPKK